jgi:hypothetical protein
MRAVLPAVVASFAVTCASCQSNSLPMDGSSRVPREPRRTVYELVQALRAGTLRAGAPLRPHTVPKPWFDGSVGGEDDELFGTYVVRDRTHVVMIYTRIGFMYAACTLEEWPTSSEVWHFCDGQLLSKHVQSHVKNGQTGRAAAN